MRLKNWIERQAVKPSSVRSSKVYVTRIVRRRSGPLVGEPGSVVGRPSTTKIPALPYS